MGPLEKLILQRDKKLSIKENNKINPHVEEFIKECERITNILKDDTLYKIEVEKWKK
jgi:hypothetical protein